MGVDEAMVLCKKFKALSDTFPDHWGLPDEDDSDDEEEVGPDRANEECCSEDGSDQSGGSQTSTGKEWEVEEIYDVRVCDEAVRLAKGAFSSLLLEPVLFYNVSLSHSSKSYMLLYVPLSRPL